MSIVSITEEEVAGLNEIQHLLDEALEHYFTYEGHCKSSEGHVSVEIDFGNSFQRRDDSDGYGTPYKVKKTIHVYSYAISTDGARSYEFDSVEEALETVRKWHKSEMAYDPFTEEEIEAREEMSRIAADFITTMQEKGKLHIIEINPEQV